MQKTLTRNENQIIIIGDEHPEVKKTGFSSKCLQQKKYPCF